MPKFATQLVVLNQAGRKFRFHETPAFVSRTRSASPGNFVVAVDENEIISFCGYTFASAFGFSSGAVLPAPLAGKTVHGNLQLWIALLNRIHGRPAEYSDPVGLFVEVRDDADFSRYGYNLGLVLGQDFLKHWKPTKLGLSMMLECTFQLCHTI